MKLFVEHQMKQEIELVCETSVTCNSDITNYYVLRAYIVFFGLLTMKLLVEHQMKQEIELYAVSSVLNEFPNLYMNNYETGSHYS